MRKKAGTLFQSVLAIAAAAVLCSSAAGQAAPTVSLEDQLKAQYNLVKMGADSNGPAIIEQGTLLDIQKGGILGVPYDNVVMPAKFQDGVLHPPSAATAGGSSASNMGKKVCGLFGKCSGVKDQAAKQATTRLFQVGEKVYPAKIQVNTEKDTVTLDIISCDSCNNVNPPTYYKSAVVFQFAKGSLATPNPSQVEDTIAQVFTIDEGGDQNGNGNGNGQGQGQDQGQGQGQGQAQGQGQGGGGQQAQATPPTIQLGQSIDDVENAMGKPEKIVNLGAKQIYVYKDLKITFIKGKVSDVE